MPAKGRVSIGWQIIFAIIAPLSFYAAYRVKKLRKYFLYVIIPGSAIEVLFAVSGRPDMFHFVVFSEYSNMDQKLFFTETLSTITSIIFLIISIYLIVEWSRLWNKQIEN